MKGSLVFLIAFAALAGARTDPPPDRLVLVEGGPFRNAKSNYFGRTAAPHSRIGRLLAVRSFYIGKYEVTQREWKAVMGDDPSQFKGDDLPVERVSWYDCVEYCDRLSLAEGLRPYYHIDKTRSDPNNGNDIDGVKWIVTIDVGANGYRLPTESEWEYAADGGRSSRNFTYPGSDDVNDVAWYFRNSGDRELNGFWSWPMIRQNHNQTKPVGGKLPNELGLYDMGGNVREWCWNWYGKEPSFGAGPASGREGRVWRGGGWMGGDFCCASTWRAGYEASGKGPDQGFRVCRNK